MRLVLVLALLLALPVHAGQTVYVSCQGDSKIEIYALDAATGALKRLGEHALAGGPGPMATSPDGQRIYVATSRRTKKRQWRHEIVTLARRADGGLDDLEAAPIEHRATYLRSSPDGKFLLTASYGAGATAVYRIADGRCTPERVDQELTERTAHCVELSPDGRFAYVPHTAPNVVAQFRFDAAQGTLEPLDPPRVAGPAEDQRFHQPRHIRFHPVVRALALTSNERGGGLSSWRLADSGQLTLLKTVCTLPPGFEGDSAAAEVRITPDGKFAYVSNRDRARSAAGQDSLTCVAVSPDGALRVVGHTPTVRFPRAFSLDATGHFLYVAGQRDDRLGCYRVDPKTGKLTQLARLPVGKRPSWVEVVGRDDW